MSVVVFRGGIIASDTLATSGNGWIAGYLFNKIARSPAGWLGGAVGSIVGAWGFVKWVEDGGPEKSTADEWLELPDCKDKDDDQGILIAPDRRAWLWEGDILIPIELHHGFVAIGSGSSIAYGALGVGANAVAAVVEACRWTSTCRMPGVALGGDGARWDFKE